MASSFKVSDINEQPETTYDDRDMEDNDEQQPSTSNANEKMANDIIKEAQSALANQEEMTSTKKHQQKAREQPLLERKAHQSIHLAKEKAHHL